jgi:hypothetical protein
MTPLFAFGISDGAKVALGLSLENEFGFNASDEEFEGCYRVSDLFALVARHAQAEAA